MATQMGARQSTTAPEEVPVIFNSAIEGFYRTYRARLTPEMKREIASLGVDFDRLDPAYSLEVFERAFRRAGELLFPSKGESERWRHMGREFVEGFAETAIGKAVVMMAKVVGPRRTLERFARTFRTGSNFAGSEAKILGDNEVELRVWMLEQFLPPWRGRPTLQMDYRHGLLEGALNQFGVRNAEVKVLEKNLLEQSVRYRIRWSP